MSNSEICLVLTNEVSEELFETIAKTVTKNSYRLNRFDTLAEFEVWCEGDFSEVCLITNENSDTYRELKSNYPDLLDCLLVDSNEEAPDNVKCFIYMDLEKHEIDTKNLSDIIESFVEIQKSNVANKKIADYKNDSGEVELPIDIEEEDKDELPKENNQPSTASTSVGAEETTASEADIQNDTNKTEDIAEQIPTEESGEKAGVLEPKVSNEQNSTIQEGDTDKDEKPPYEKNPYPMRLRNIQKSLSGPKMDKHKTIGVWSPLPAMGVTSFLINFSLFLAENKVHTAVLESLTNDHILRDWLKRYCSIPEKWVSLASNLHASEVAGDSEWIYRGVKFFPLNKDDCKQEWSLESFGAYHRMTEIYDVTLIDMPSGEMDVFTKESLEYIDELWIMVDDRVQEINSWKHYIKNIKEEHRISIHLIHNKIIKASKPNVLIEELGFSMLATLPALWEETATNYYQNKPLYLQLDVQSKLQKPYHQLATHLIGSSFQFQDEKPSMWKQLVKLGKFQNILNG